MTSKNRSSGNPKKPYIQPQFTKLTPTDAKSVVKAKAIAGDAGTEQMLQKLKTREKLTRGAEIQKQLKKLRAELAEFADPTPADAPFEYELEEIEAFENLKQKICSLENELEEITKHRIEATKASPMREK